MRTAQGARTREQVTAYSYDAWGRLEKVKYDYLGGDPSPHWPLSAPVDISTADVAYACEQPIGDVEPCGKQLMAEKLLPFFAPHHTYDEVFCGVASLLFAKPLKSTTTSTPTS